MDFRLRWVACAVVVGIGSAVTSNVAADDAPTILFEDAIYTCEQEQSTSIVRAQERYAHSTIARHCQGRTVCRISADMVTTAGTLSAGCDELVVVPVCAVLADDAMNENASAEMTLRLTPGRSLVINCSGVANPHF